MLERLDHQQNPEHETYEMEQQRQAETESPVQKVEANAENGEAAKNDDRLGRMKLHERALIN